MSDSPSPVPAAASSGPAGARVGEPGTLRRRAPLLLAAGIVLLLVPFLDKAWTIDDTLFVRNAEQLLEHPLRPYDFDYNWYGTPLSMWRITQNPPLVCYVLAAWMAVFGRSEIALHASNLLFAAGCAATMFALARRYCAHPATATVAALVAPAFLVTATSVMADVPLLFFFLLAVLCTEKGAESRQGGWLWAAGLCGAAAAMTKYFGAAVAPLVVVLWLARTAPLLAPEDRGLRAWWTLLCGLRRGRWSGHLLGATLPIVVLAAWGTYAWIESGIFHPLGAATYSDRLKGMVGEMAALDMRLLYLDNTVSYLGGSAGWALLAWPLVFVHPRGTSLAVRIALPVGTLVAYGLGVAAHGTMLSHARGLFAGPDAAWGTAVFLAAGSLVLLVGLVSMGERPDPASLVLGAWLAGTVVFSAAFNWTVNARILLPAVFPAAVLIVRRIERLDAAEAKVRWAWGVLVPTTVVSLVLTVVDVQAANAGRTYARTAVRDLLKETPRVFFSAHWGVQFYLEQEGAVAYDYAVQAPRLGDRLVYDMMGSPTTALGPWRAADHVVVPNPWPLAVMDVRSLAGFYSSLWGPVPWSRALASPHDPERPCSCGRPGCEVPRTLSRTAVLAEFKVEEIAVDAVGP